MPFVPRQSCRVFRAEDIFVTQGVNAGDDLSGPDEICLGDIYQLDSTAKAVELILRRDDAGEQVAPESPAGSAGAPVQFLSRYTLMAPDGDKVQLLVLRAGDELLALPMSPMGARVDYTLVTADPPPEAVHLADLICVSFARGTTIMLAGGQQRPIERLSPGDLVLTRDHGSQPVRWIGKATLRAQGSFAPVVIAAGVMGNAGDLIVSQHHRMFLYRRRQPGVATSELLVQARHMVDGERIFVREGGFVDYYSLVFDRHEIIYAEGIPAESLLVNEATLRRLPRDLASEVQARFPGVTHVQHFGTEADPGLLDRLGPETLMQRPREGR